jgi:hypothetical protein
MKVREGVGEVKFTGAEIDKMEAVARGRDEESYLLLRLWGRRGLRVTETLKITKSDVRDKGVWISQKGGERVLKILPPEVYGELSSYASKLKVPRVFPISRMTAYNLSQSIAKEAGIDRWERVHPHRWRHFFRNLPGSKDRQRPLEGKKPHGPQGSPGNSDIRGQSKPRRRTGGIVKVDIPTNKRFWVPGVVATVLFGQSFAILSQPPFASLWFLSYEQAIILGVLEMFAVLVLTVIFLWKTVVWWHERPRELKHVFDDPNILA